MAVAAGRCAASFFALQRTAIRFTLTPVGTYAYHAEMTSDYGDAWFWSIGGRGFLARDRWYCIEQQFKVNTSGRKDGVLRAWIDGYLVYEKTDVHVRDIPRIRIEQIWMDVYHGGREVAASELHLFIDNVVIATAITLARWGSESGAARIESFAC